MRPIPASNIFLEAVGLRRTWDLRGYTGQALALLTGRHLAYGYRHIERREAAGGYPNADRVMRSGMLMACHHGLTAEDLAYIHDRFRAFAGQW